MKAKKIIKQNYKELNVDEILNNIKKEKRFSKVKTVWEADVIKNLDILDGRRTYGKPFKKFAKIMDFGMYLLSCAVLSAIIVLFILAWI